ncbi:MAG: hypothetical protein PUJ11_02385 [Eubacteriaceae bacterium]|nr:hypothetical protein [Eubacteriaceae bacterium]
MARNTLPFIVFFLILQKNQGMPALRLPRIQRDSLYELESLISNAQRIMDTMDRINSIPDIKKITEIVDNFSA